MSMTTFIKEYKEEVDNVLKSWGSKLTYDERVLAVLNDEGLYLLAVENRVHYYGERV